LHTQEICLLQDRYEAGDYRDMKSDYGDMVRRLEAKLSAIKTDTKDIEGLLKTGIENLLKLN